jgi:acyl carrier protein
VTSSFSREALRALVFEVLAGIAPEADPGALAGDAPLRDQLDLDSMDFLNLLVGIHERTGLDIPESDYGELQTLDALVAYLARAGAAVAKPGG